MRKLIYAIIIVSLFLIPIKRADVAKLMPVEAVAMYLDGNEVVLETDTGNLGRGENVLKALENLKEKASAVVYLDTAEFLLVAENAVSRIEELGQYMKQSVKVCVCEVSGRVKEAVKYLDVHGNLHKLRDWNKEK